ncbi:hypothetical protein CU097_007565 [Rhizopus azygosporus]|uniref:Uncharacterized protein n=1 Tax=Rhizopus azygosporus TaxID=86630 RepID=A0A367JXP3_RHIAZ|nr:hypothetical protein CU097_007565 [Rhizopus azygosporus]
MEMASETRNYDSIHACSGNFQKNSGFRVQTPFPEEQLDATPTSILSPTTDLGTKRRGPLCRSEYHPAKKVRVMAIGPWQLRDGCFYHALEPDNVLSTENHSRETPSDDNGDSLLANGNLVASSPDSQCDSTNHSVSGNVDSTPISFSNTADDRKQQLDALHLKILNKQFNSPQLNHAAQQTLTQHLLQGNSTNRSYYRDQILFLVWVSTHPISDTNFTKLGLIINFLSTMHSQHKYAVSTIQLFRSAVTYFHQNPRSLSIDQFINNFISQLFAQASPIRLNRATIDFQSIFNYLSNLDNNQTSFAALQGKLAFLLEVHCPKEKLRERCIIKSFQVSAHTISSVLCPVQTLMVFAQRRPQCFSTSLFVNSVSPNKPLQATTIQGWLSKLLRKSTTEPRVNIRPIASSLALAAGIPKEDVVTMDNWSNSQTFENHYFKHLSLFNFTNILIHSEDVPMN